MQLARYLVLGAVLIISACDDPDNVPETHISATPAPVASGAAKDIERNPLKNAYFGDLHVHTSWSMDAYSGGNRLGPNSAYRFARGETVELPNGEATRLAVPLDFVALTDHAEGFGTHLLCTVPGAPEFETEVCTTVREGIPQEQMLRNAFAQGTTRPVPRDPDLCKDEERCLENARNTWQLVQDSADAFNDPGTFTTLIGYEFSSLLFNFGMLHRNVIFRGSDVIPHAISAQDVRNQREFFEELDNACAPPCEVLTIPHNTNFSWGVTFARTDEDGADYSIEDLERRARMDRLFEITQQKGNSECQISVGASDEYCNFGNTFPVCKEGQDTKCAMPASFYRNVVLDGLALEEELDVNPNKMGVIGSTDTHNSDPGNTRNNTMLQRFGGLMATFAAERVLTMEHVVIGSIRKLSPGGLAAVWAEANTRGDIYDALHRRESFGTSGSRMKIRFFAGDYPEDMATVSDPVAMAYEKGVPMGGDMPPLANPRFWVWASHDPMGVKLERVQVIKGWTESGEQHHKVWDVACSGGRVPGADGQCPDGYTGVDLETCEPTGKPGEPELQATFTDPDYDAGQSAFYYVRVLEDPVCGWPTMLANEGGADLPTDIPPAIQDRGWSSPIWVSAP